METETCDKCKKTADKGTLIRDSVDAALLYCAACKPKTRKPRKKKQISIGITVPMAEIMKERAAKFEQRQSLPVDPALLKKDVEKWAQECGLGNIRADGPNREDYPYYGFGYSFQIQEIAGKQRKASARYTSSGQRSFWTIDGIVTG